MSEIELSKQPGQPSAADSRRKAPKRLAIYESPIRLLVLIGVTMFVTHTLAMVLFAPLPQFPMWIESLIESVLLMILLFPVLYYVTTNSVSTNRLAITLTDPNPNSYIWLGAARPAGGL